MSKWKKVKLGDVCSLYQPKTIPMKELKDDMPYYVYGANGIIGKYHSYNHIDSEIAIACRGATCGTVNITLPKSWITGNAMVAHIESNELSFKYLFYALSNANMKNVITGAAQPQITRSNLKDLEIPLPAMEEQKKIAARLDAVSDLLAKQKQLLSEQDNLIQSTFYDMFGDPIKNEKGWNSKKFSELGSLKNGINFQKNDNESDLYCLGVADFKDNKYISDISALQKVPSKSVNLTEDLLKNGDIVFVRSNGNKALVGRCVAVYPNEEAVTFSGFCIRFRKSTTLIKTDYLLYFLKTPQIRNALAGRGANIQNLNQQILSRVNILCPPLELQQKFAAVAEQIESEKSKIKSAIAETQTLFNALMTEYFEE